ncbi:MAG TPA: DUF2723 domain-containing protein, partial [Candidatus Hydrogenedentes bacterium]|nr:DUF2723 domain-containing protein [Candidatus Hydrogenedentota bacterium]
MSNDSYLDPLNDEVRDGPISLHEIVIPEDTPLPSVKPAILAGGIAASVAAIYFVVSMGNGMAFGPWQGAYLDPSFPYRTPLISLWLGRAMAAIPLGDAAWRLSFVSALFGAAACGMLAIIAARSLRERSGTGAAVIAGVASGLLFALTPTWSATIISNAPAVTTVLLALSGLACLQHAIETHAPRWLLPTGTAIGLATVNDPSFAIVLIIALLAALGTLGERVPVGRVFAMLFAGFALTASIPFARAMFDGEGTDGFLHHAIATAYPTIGDGLPRLGFGLELRPQFSWMVLAATILGLTALFLRGMRGAATMWALLFLAMGPFWPALTNQRSSEYVLRETGAAESIACAAVCICALWGAAWLARAITRGNQGRLAAAVAAVTAAGMLGFQVAELPARDSALAATIADRMLADCGRDALLVTGDARTTALLRTAQISRGVRTDVGIVAVHALEQGETRSALSKLHGDSLSVARDFPPDNAWTRWPVERPNEFGTLNATMMSGGLRESDFRDLMLWEFMRDNFADRKIH